MTRLPKQIAPCHDLIRSWTVERPAFYGLTLTPATVGLLTETESMLANGVAEGLNPTLCRVLAAFHGPKGAKVPLSLATVSGCVRPAFISLNPWLTPGSLSCYDGGCYLFHARAVPPKKTHEFKVRAHITPRDGLVAAAELSRRYGLPLRDNQSSDGSLSMGLSAKGHDHSQLHINLSALADTGYQETPYLCFSSAYTRVPEDVLQSLSVFRNLIVHVTVSGWHSREENSLRLNEFVRYAMKLPNTFLRVVHRQDWAGIGPRVPDSGARVEDWLLNEVETRGLVSRIIRTPFHSVHPFPGSQPGNLGTRHMANTDYGESWLRLHTHGAQGCCTTGKCKTCPTQCGVSSERTSRNLAIAAKAYDALLAFEMNRQQQYRLTPLSVYTARLVARKATEAYEEAGRATDAGRTREKYLLYDFQVKSMSLTQTERKRMVNDSHALVIDGLDRHGLWTRVGEISGAMANA